MYVCIDNENNLLPSFSRDNTRRQYRKYTRCDSPGNCYNWFQSCEEDDGLVSHLNHEGDDEFLCTFYGIFFTLITHHFEPNLLKTFARPKEASTPKSSRISLKISAANSLSDTPNSMKGSWHEFFSLLKNHNVDTKPRVIIRHEYITLDLLVDWHRRLVNSISYMRISVKHCNNSK